MELIVDGKNVMKSVNLEKNKQEIKKLRASVPSKVSLTHFKEKVGLFRANVKGGDLNGLVTELQECFSDINIRETNMYDQLDTVFKTVESIHKGSIEGVIVGVKSAQKAIEQAEYAIEQINETLLILQSFKEQLEQNTEHLNDIDSIWDDTQQLYEEISKLKSFLNNKIVNEIKVLVEFKDSLGKIKHINDIDKMFINLHSLNNELKKATSNADSRFTGIENDLNLLKKHKETIENIVYFREIDKMYQDLHQCIGDLKSFRYDYIIDIVSIDGRIDDLDELKKSLEGIKHLKDVDLLWNSYEGIKHVAENAEKVGSQNSNALELFTSENHRNMTDLAGRVSELENYREELVSYTHLKDIDSTWDRIQQYDNVIEKIKKDVLRFGELQNEVTGLKGKLKISYYLIGGTICITILQFVLNLVGVL